MRLDSTFGTIPDVIDRRTRVLKIVREGNSALLTSTVANRATRGDTPAALRDLLHLRNAGLVTGRLSGNEWVWWAV